MGTARLTPAQFVEATREVFDGLVVEGVSGAERTEWLRALGRLESMVVEVRSRLVSAHRPLGAGLVGSAERASELVRAAGISQREARRSVRVAEALAEAPALAAALAAGEVTAGHVEALAFGVDRLDRVVADADPGLQAAARELPVDAFRAVVDEWQRARSSDIDGGRLAQRQERRRRAGWRLMPDGMLRLEAELAPDTGAVVVGELGRLAEGLWRGEDGRAGEPGPERGPGQRQDGGQPGVAPRTVVQRNADALAEMARRSAGGAQTGGESAGKVVESRTRADIVCVLDYAWILRQFPQVAGDVAVVDTARPLGAGLEAGAGARAGSGAGLEAGGRGDLEAGAGARAGSGGDLEAGAGARAGSGAGLEAGGRGDLEAGARADSGAGLEAGGRGALEAGPGLSLPAGPVVGPARCESDDGIGLTATQLRRLACDAGILPVVFDGKGQALDLGRRQRVVTPGQRIALVARDGGCVFPGCDRPASWCDAHHVIHWFERGPTDLWNLCLLCSAHHHIVHDGGWRLRHRDPSSRDGNLEFVDPMGRAYQPDRRLVVGRRPTAA